MIQSEIDAALEDAIRLIEHLGGNAGFQKKAVAARLAQEREDAEPITPDALWRAGANEGECHTDFEKEFAFWTQGDHDCSDGVILYVRRTGANVPYFARVSDDDGFGVMLDKPLKTMGDVFRLCDDFGIKLEALKGTPCQD